MKVSTKCIPNDVKIRVEINGRITRIGGSGEEEEEEVVKKKKL